MAKLKYVIAFLNNYGKRTAKEFEFNDQQHFDNWFKKQSADESYRKIIGMTKIEEQEVDSNKIQVTIEQLKFAYSILPVSNRYSFEEWVEECFKLKL